MSDGDDVQPAAIVVGEAFGEIPTQGAAASLARTS